MSHSFINSVYEDLIINNNFLPVNKENGEQTKDDNIKSLQKSSNGVFTIIELINIDHFTNDEIKERLAYNRDFIFGVKDVDMCYFFEVFVSANGIDQEKLDMIKSGQAQRFWKKKYFKCLTVSLSDKKVEKFFSTPVFLMLPKTLKKVLETDYNSYSDCDRVNKLLDEQKQEENLFNFTAKPIITIALIAINAFVFLFLNYYSMKTGSSYESLLEPFGAKSNLLIIKGEYWRLITPIFLHADIRHLMLNCYSLFVFGMLVEKIYGYKKFLFIYFISGIMGNIASFVFSIHNGVGASGSIFGLLGALLYFGAEFPKLFGRYFGSNVIATIIINIVYGAMNKQIDNFAHLGGLIGGFLSAGQVKLNVVSKKQFNSFIFVIITYFIMALGMYYGFKCPQNLVLVRFDNLEAVAKTKNYSEIEKMGESILSMNPKNENILTGTLWHLAIAKISQGKFDDAIEYAKKLVVYSSADGHYLLGLAYYNSNQFELAKEELTKAQKLGSPNKDRINSMLIGIDFSKDIDKLKELYGKASYIECEKSGEMLLAKNPQSKDVLSEVLWYTSLSELEQYKYEQLIEHSKLLVDISPADGHYLLGLAYFDTKKYALAEEQLKQAKELGSPNTEKIDNLLKLIEK